MSTPLLPLDVFHLFLGLAKYKPPVSSLIIIMSTPSITEGFSELELSRLLKTFTGLMFANKPRNFLKPNIASSGLCWARGSSHLGPPTAPNNTASLELAISSDALGNGSPESSRAAPPTNPYFRLNLCDF